MPILLKRKNGEITRFRNAEFIPAFYFIPKSILDRCGSELNSIPRNPHALLHDWNAIAMVESDLFLLAIIDAYAFMVWPFMMPGVNREIYSGYEPSWILAHSPAYWIQGLQDEKILPTAEELFKNGGVDKNFGYVSDEIISYIFSWLVPRVMRQHNMNEVIETAKQFRCFEDFDYRNSRQKIDFFRKWYHTRTQHPTVSLEEFKKKYSETHNGLEWDIADENSDLNRVVLEPMSAKEFMASLDEKDRQILRMRDEGIAYEKIAQKLGYKSRSTIKARIEKIGEKYEKFSGENFGFSRNKTN